MVMMAIANDGQKEEWMEDDVRRKEIQWKKGRKKADEINETKRNQKKLKGSLRNCFSKHEFKKFTYVGLTACAGKEKKNNIIYENGQLNWWRCEVQKNINDDKKSKWYGIYKQLWQKLKKVSFFLTLKRRILIGAT